MSKITWEQTKNNEFQSAKGTDDQGNRFWTPANRETVSVITHDGLKGLGWTAKEALANALLKRYAEFLSELGVIREEFIKSVSEAHVNDAVAFLQAVNVRNQAVKDAQSAIEAS